MSGGAVTGRVDELAATVRDVYDAVTPNAALTFDQRVDARRRFSEALSELAAIARDAEQLRRERDELYEANWPWEWVIATREKERREAAEATVARLQAELADAREALRKIAEPRPKEEGDWGATYDWHESSIYRRDVARAALSAGATDVGADSEEGRRCSW